MRKKNILLVSVAILCISNCLQVKAQKNLVMTMAKKVVTALKNKDMKSLATFVHPVKGVRFSPFGYISKKDDLVFKNNQIPALMGSAKVYLWGYMDESEQPIKKTFAGYYKDFVYDYDFARPDRINYNLKRNNGIMINNIGEIYPQGIEVEYYIDGTDDRMYGSLRLVFERRRAVWYLVGIVRDTPGI